MISIVSVSLLGMLISFFSFFLFVHINYFSVIEFVCCLPLNATISLSPIASTTHSEDNSLSPIASTTHSEDNSLIAIEEWT